MSHDVRAESLSLRSPASDLATGMLVQHATLGVGKVVAVERTAVHVFFPGRDRYAAKFHLPAARTLLKSAGLDRDEWLEGLTSFSLDPVSRRYALAANWITHDEAIAEFRVAYPRGFLDPAYVGTATGTGKLERASRWRRATAEWVQALGEGQAEKLLDKGAVGELVKRVLRVEAHVVLAVGTLPAGALAQALRPEASAHAFLEALLAVLAVPSPSRGRFEKLFAATDALELEPGQAWPVATMFPFIAEPGKHVFLAPKSACGAAERLGCDLRFEPEPNWPTYSALRGFAAKLLTALAPSGARDFVDVEGFLYATAAHRAPAAHRTRDAATSPGKKPTRRATKV
jgi:hypothetical protein